MYSLTASTRRLLELGDLSLGLGEFRLHLSELCSGGFGLLLQLRRTGGDLLKLLTKFGCGGLGFVGLRLKLRLELFFPLRQLGDVLLKLGSRLRRRDLRLLQLFLESDCSGIGFRHVGLNLCKSRTRILQLRTEGDGSRLRVLQLLLQLGGFIPGLRELTLGGCHGDIPLSHLIPKHDGGNDGGNSQNSKNNSESGTSIIINNGGGIHTPQFTALSA